MEENTPIYIFLYLNVSLPELSQFMKMSIGQFIKNNNTCDKCYFELKNMWTLYSFIYSKYNVGFASQTKNIHSFIHTFVCLQ